MRKIRTPACFLSRTLFVLLCSNLPLLAQTETWHLDPNHSAAQFSVRHMGISTVRGTFTKVGGDIIYYASDPTKSSIDVTIDAASVDTRVEMRDNDLRSPNYLEIAKYPAITFKSTHIAAPRAGKLAVTGNLTIHGVTKEVVLDVDGPSAPITDKKGNLHMGASASTKINRQDFGVGGSSPAIGNELAILIDVEMIKEAQTPPLPAK
jgi:polyisoprenoid-binding protein YceI